MLQEQRYVGDTNHPAHAFLSSNIYVLSTMYLKDTVWFGTVWYLKNQAWGTCRWKIRTVLVILIIKKSVCLLENIFCVSMQERCMQSGLEILQKDLEVLRNLMIFLTYHFTRMGYNFPVLRNFTDIVSSIFLTSPAEILILGNVYNIKD